MDDVDFFQRDIKTGEPWFMFCQRRGIDAVSMAFGQAWVDHMTSRAASVQNQRHGDKDGNYDSRPKPPFLAQALK